MVKSGSSEAIDIGLDEKRLFKPSPEFVANARLNKQNDYQKMYRQSIDDPETFWGNIAAQFIWHRHWDRVCDQDNPPFVRWFAGAQLNITENCLDRHLSTAKDKAAFIWEGESGERRTLTYSELYREVCACANALKKLGVKRGDRVVIYLPMIPELPVSMLACARLGAIHSVIFAGFSAPALIERINNCDAKVVITADGGFRNNKIIKLKKMMDEALAQIPSVEYCLVVVRANCTHKMQKKRDQYWHELLQYEESTCEPVVMDAHDPLFILHTSGSTGKPKGIQHSIAGYMVGVATSCKYVFDLKENDTYWCTADIGWITGHSYLVYGPLLNGATSLIYEGAPFYPQPDRFWQIIAQHQVNILYTAPTAIRAAMKHGDQWVEKQDLSSLRLLGSVGEPINPKAWMWYHNKVGDAKCPIVDTWWQTETGAIMISPLPGITATRPGSATIPFFGVDAAVVDEEGKEIANGKGGLLVIRKPWPSMLTNIWRDPERFKQVYWSRFADRGYYLAGDAAVCDEQGYFTILGLLIHSLIPW